MGSRVQAALAAGVVALFIVLVALAAPGAERTSRDVRATTFHASPHGAKALFLTLEELGVRSERRLTPFVDADSLKGSLAVLAPTFEHTPAEVGALLRRVRSGGSLLYVPRGDDLILDSLGLRLESLVPDSVSPFRVASWQGVIGRPVPHAWTTELGPVRGFRHAFADSSTALRRDGVARLLTAPAGEAVAVAFSLGRGTVLVLSDPRPLINQRLRTSGVALLLARAAADGTPERRTLYFDEYHHGYRGNGSPVAATLHFLTGTRPGYLVLQLLLACAGLFVLLGWRFGAPVPPRPTLRRSPLEHADALAGAYRQGGARRTARQRLVASLARRTGRRPLGSEAEEAAFLEQLVSRSRTDRAAALALQSEWNKGDQADLVVLARHIDGILTERLR